MCRGRPIIVLMLALFTLLLAGHIGRTLASGPKTSRPAKVKLEALKKKLPALLARWIKDNKDGKGQEELSERIEAKVRLARLIGPAKAKVTVQLTPWLDGKPCPEFDCYFTLYLRFYDGHWTTTSYKPTGQNLDFDLLMLAIDEACE